MILTAGLVLSHGALAGEPPSRIVVALLVDGLSGQMLERIEAPNLARVREEGAWSHDLVPTFPAISGPTWVSLSTGCWPERHGVVTDKFLDPTLGLMDHSGDPRWLVDCELLQTVAERQGITTAALGWWGQWSPEAGKTASYVSANARVEQQVPRDPTAFLSDAGRAREVVRYLQMPARERPGLILAYLRGPDHAAHFGGLFSQAHAAAMRDLDDALGEILRALEALPDSIEARLVLVSDHGMVPVHAIVNVRRILRRHGIAARDISTGTTSFLYFDDAAEVETAARALRGYQEFEIYEKGELPDFARLGSGPRVPELVLSARPGYYTADAELWPWYFRTLTWVGPDFLSSPLLGSGISAAHGYPPGVPDNHGVFYAWGSGIESGARLGSVRMVDVHPTLAYLLGIEPGSPVDGAPIRALVGTGSAAGSTLDEVALRP